MNKQEAYKFIADHVESRPISNNGTCDGRHNFIHRVKAIMLVDKIFDQLKLDNGDDK